MRQFAQGGLIGVLVALSPGVFLIGCLPDAPEPAELPPLAQLEISRDDGFEWHTHGVDSIGRVTATAIWRDVLVVADRTSSRIFGFDGSGDILFAIGGSGEGPGELVTLMRIGTQGDSLWAYDRSLRRVTYWDLDDAGSPRLLDTEDVPGSSEVGGVLQRGVWGRFRPEECIIFDDEPFADCEWGVADGDREVAILRARPGFGRVINLGNRETVAFQPFGTDPVMTDGSDGGAVVVLRRVVSDTLPGTVRVERVGLDGEVVQERLIRSPTTAVTAALVSRAVRESLPTMSRRIQELPNVTERLIAAIDRPTHVPPFDSVGVGTDGAIWLRGNWALADGRTWIRLDEELAPEATMTVPSDHRVLELGRDTVWLISWNPLGVPDVARYHIIDDPVTPARP